MHSPIPSNLTHFTGHSLLIKIIFLGISEESAQMTFETMSSLYLQCNGIIVRTTLLTFVNKKYNREYNRTYNHLVQLRVQLPVQPAAP